MTSQVRVRLEALLDDNAGQGPRPNIFTLMAPLLREFKRKVGRIARLASPLNRYCMSERGRDRGFEPSILDLGLRVFREKVRLTGLSGRVGVRMQMQGL